MKFLALPYSVQRLPVKSQTLNGLFCFFLTPSTLCAIILTDGGTYPCILDVYLLVSNETNYLNHMFQDALKKLWRLAFPTREIPPLKSELWKEMGWQGTDPSTDFRLANVGCLILQ